MEVPEIVYRRILEKVEFILEESLEPLFYEIRKHLCAEWREGFRAGLEASGQRHPIQLPPSTLAIEVWIPPWK